MARHPGLVVRPADWTGDRAMLQSIRETVFVHEQGVPLHLEWDEFDAVSRHVLACVDRKAVGTGRLLPDGHVGRMAVLREWRGHGVGSAMLESLMGMARLAGMRQVELNAQTQAVRFYERHGFEAYGAAFLDAGIPHTKMRRAL